MGYPTDFSGQLEFTNPLTTEQVKYIQAFSGTRRMVRNAKIAEKLPDPIREAVGLPIGFDSMYFVGNQKDFGQEHDESIIDYNSSGIMPGLWCKWTVSDDGKYLFWNGAEKFYNYIEWLNFLIDNLFDLWGTELNGEITWEGESGGDRGSIIAIASAVSTTAGAQKTLYDCTDEDLIAELKRRLDAQ